MQWPVTGLVGGSGAGKSTLLRSFLRASRRAVVFDPVGEHSGDITCQSADDFLYLVERAGNDLPKQGIVVVRFRSRDEFCALLPVVATFRDCLFAVDEIGWALPGRAILPAMDECVRFARHDSRPFVWVSQRVVDVPPLLWSYADLYLFRQSAAADLDVMRGIVGPDGAAEIRDLPDYIAVHRSPTGIRARVRVSPNSVENLVDTPEPEPVE